MRRIAAVLLPVLMLVAGCGSSSKPVTTTPLAPTTIALAASPATLVEGATVDFSAAVASTATSKPTGTVAFLAGTATLGTAPLQADGTATLSVAISNLPIGVNALTASYGGDSANEPSTSGPVNVTVQTNTTTTLSSSPTTIPQGLPYVLTAQVARNSNPGGTGYATGTVTFLQGTTTLGTASLSNGAAQIKLPSAALPQGTLSLTAQYAGDSLDIASNSSTLAATVTGPLDVLTYRNNVARTSVQSQESTLTPTNVNASTFGKVFTLATDGYVYAEPLYVAGYQMNDGQLHNVLYVATTADSVYAFDADNNNPSAGYLWKVSTLGEGEETQTQVDTNCADMKTDQGIVGTPVIDRALGVLYLVSASKLVSGNTTTFYQRIHALNLATGAEMLNGPTEISASVPGTGAGSVGGVVSFDPLRNNQRAALAEANGSVWIAWASHCDYGNYHGWVIGYNANDVSQQTGVFNTTPNGEEGGIWMSGGGIAADNAGNLFVAAGNGDFDGNDGEGDYADTAQRLAIDPSTSALTLGDWFTPSDQQYLTDNDQDMGTVDTMLFDDPASGVAPHLLATGDKTGRVYLLNRDAMGGYDSGAGGANGDVEDARIAPQVFSSFAYFNQQIYIGAGGEPLVAYPFTPGTETTAGYVTATPSSATATSFSANYSSGGINPMISANGTADGIVWGQDVSARVLYAFDASNLANQLYASSTNSTRDQPAPPVKMTVPTIANGRVYVGGQSAVSVYGLLQ